MDNSLITISLCEFMKTIKTKANVETDIIVPDTKPDIYRVLSVTALADTNEQIFKKDKMIFSGSIKFNILYCGEDDTSKVHSITYTSPFNHQSDFHGVDEDCVFACICKVHKTSFEVKNSRKLSVRADLCFDIHTYKNGRKDIVSQTTENEIYPSKTIQYECDCPVEHKTFDFEITDTFTIPCKDESTSICNVFVNIDMSDIKAVNTKAVLKGQANIKAIYEDEGEISDYSTELSFTEVADMEALSSEHRMVSHFEVCNVEYDSGFTDMGLTVDLTFRVRGYIIAYEHMEIHAVSDIYSPDYSYEKLSENIYVSALSDIRQSQETLKDSIEVPSGDVISKIYHMDSIVQEDEAVIGESAVKLTGSVFSVIIYGDENGTLCRATKSTPYEFNFPFTVSGDENHIISSVSCTNSGYIMGSANDIQIRIIMNARIVVLSNKKSSIVTEFKVDSKNPIQKEDQPSIVVFFPDSSSDIWEIAKKYNTTCEEIAGVNSLDISKPLPQNKPILIPKRQI